MGRMKEWGFKVAAMLFEQRMTVDQVVEALSIQLVPDPNGGLPIVQELDKDWLRQQVIAVYTHRTDWGYSFGKPNSRMFVPAIKP